MPQTCDWDTRKLALLNSHKSDVIVLKPLADTTTGCLDDTDCTEGQQCLALSCPAYRRCGMNTTRGVLAAQTSCEMACYR